MVIWYDSIKPYLLYHKARSGTPCLLTALREDTASTDTQHMHFT